VATVLAKIIFNASPNKKGVMPTAMADLNPTNVVNTVMPQRKIVATDRVAVNSDFVRVLHQPASISLPATMTAGINPNK